MSVNNILNTFYSACASSFRDNIWSRRYSWNTAASLNNSSYRSSLGLNLVLNLISKRRQKRKANCICGSAYKLSDIR